MCGIILAALVLLVWLGGAVFWVSRKVMWMVVVWFFVGGPVGSYIGANVLKSMGCKGSSVPNNCEVEWDRSGPRGVCE